MTVDFEVSWWHDIVVLELKGRLDGFHLLFDCHGPKSCPRFLVDLECFIDCFRNKDAILMSSLPVSGLDLPNDVVTFA